MRYRISRTFIFKDLFFAGSYVIIINEVFFRGLPGLTTALLFTNYSRLVLRVSKEEQFR
jgi:hypothetical protein